MRKFQKEAYRVVVLICAVCVSSGTFAELSQNNSSPSLAETRDWIHSQLNEKHFAVLDTSTPGAPVLKMNQYGAELDDANKCAIRYADSFLIALPTGPIKGIQVLLLDLSMVNFSEVKCSQNNDGNKISFVLEIPASSGTKYSGVFMKERNDTPTSTSAAFIKVNFNDNDHDLCERLVKAVKHGAQLCGAKADPF